MLLPDGERACEVMEAAVEHDDSGLPAVHPKEMTVGLPGQPAC